MPRLEVVSEGYIPKQPVRALLSKDVNITEADKMARAIGGQARFYDQDPDDVPYLEHPLGIRVRFGEGFPTPRNPSPYITVSLDETLSVPPPFLRTKDGDLVFLEATIERFDDSVVISQHGSVSRPGQQVEYVDELTLTREGYKFERRYSSD